MRCRSADSLRIGSENVESGRRWPGYRAKITAGVGSAFLISDWGGMKKWPLSDFYHIIDAHP